VGAKDFSEGVPLQKTLPARRKPKRAFSGGERVKRRVFKRRASRRARG
jgi:hypothetical protein